MEHVQGITVAAWLKGFTEQKQDVPVDAIARVGAALAQAAHSLHQQNVCHLDLKPANALVLDEDRIVLLDFGLSCHADYPDLMAEEFRKAVGSPAWIAPEQVVGVRGDPRSDVFAIGVILYEMATGELPYGFPATQGGLRQRLWMSPRPPRAWRPDLPEWLQEIILRCLEPQAEQRYPSAAHLMFDLRHPDQVRITERGKQLHGRGFWWHFKRWLRAAGMEYQPSPLPTQQINEVPIVMVALPHDDISDSTMIALRQATVRSLGTRPGARLAIVTVVSSGIASTDKQRSETWLIRHHLASFRKWAEGIDLSGHQLSFHVLESGDVAQALLRYAEGNKVSLIIMGAATRGLSMQRFVATVPIKVAMHAPCTVLLVKEPTPFQQWATSDEDVALTPTPPVQQIP
jgi:serine/threonine protein kinase